MQADEIEGCCGLQVISDLKCLGQEDAFSREESEKLADYLSHLTSVGGTYDGSYITASVAILSENDQDFVRQRKTLVKAGMKLLGTFPGSHQAYKGHYKCHLFGSKEFTLPRRKK